MLLSSEKEVVEVVIAYVFQERGMKDIAKHHGVSDSTVKKRLVDFGVAIRDTHEQRRCDRRHGRYSHGDALRRAWKRGAFDTEAFKATRHHWYAYDRYGDRNPFFGKKHSQETCRQLATHARSRSLPAIGKYGDDWTPELREQIVARDGRRCQVCHASSRMLQVHHVDLDRTNNDQSNLLTLCAACHLAYHGRRELVDEVAAAHEALIQKLACQPELKAC